MPICKYTTETFIQKANQIYHFEYDYSKVNYINSQTKILIRCKLHDRWFWQTPNSHLQGNECPSCGNLKISQKLRMTQEEFLEKCHAVHGDTYDYSLTHYTNNYTKIIIICKIHGLFEQNPDSHMRGTNCPTCMHEQKAKEQTKTQEQFIQKAVKVHGNEYDYSKVHYVDNHTKVTIICKKHGSFEQQPSNHLSGQRCPVCGRENSILHRTKTTEKFIQKARAIHGNKYDYSLVHYVDNHTKVTIICKDHGPFEQTPRSHLNGSGCPTCAIIEVARKQTKTQEQFIQESIEIHGNDYDYSQVHYISSREKIIIICKKHGPFLQAPVKHLAGHKCPKCRESHGERMVRKFLEDHSILFKPQYSFKNLRNQQPLHFDFAVFNSDNSIKTLIEFQGKQHYHPIKWKPNMTEKEVTDSFRSGVYRDNLKRQYCKENNLPLLEISYTDSQNIPNILFQSLIL
ncbi:Uncharacterised protein [uncultured archaeon]|nr:Uncharacterised protein [uncultured archaeon]